MRSWLVWTALGGLGIVLLAAVALLWLARASLPQVAGELVLAGLRAPVTVVRDAHAIPHVTAQSEADLYRAMGFLHGQDRLWQMEFDRLAGQGRLAEVLGPAALPHDRFVRTLGLPRMAERIASDLDAATLELLEAYVAGVNAAMAGYGLALPPEFLILRHRPEPWRPADSLLFLKMMALDLSGNWRQELLRARLARRLRPDQLALLWPGVELAGPVTMAALADLPLDGLAEALPAGPAAGIGSNVWVAAGSRTASAAPLLANDPHLGLQMPGQWYLAHLEAPGLAVIGATLPGAPFVVLGRNREIAWGFTNTGSDSQDLFVERLDPADPGRYLTPAGSEPFGARIETITVRGAAAERLEVRTTRHGPVLSGLAPTAASAVEDGHALALAWTQLQDHGPDTTMAAGFALGRAETPSAFVAAAELYRGAQQNMAFAARSGTIGMISPGLVPIRRAGDGRTPVPGWTGEYDWEGVIPADALPRRLEPPSGLLINANNRLVDGTYPFFLGEEWQEPFRAERIAAALGELDRFDVDSMAAIQLDQLSGLFADFRRHLPEADRLAPEHAGLVAALAAWDGKMLADRSEPLIFAAWLREFGHWLAARFLEPELAELGAGRAGFLRRAVGRCETSDSECREAAAEALATAIAKLRERHGRDWRRWRWGDAHTAVLGHRPLEAASVLRRWFSRLVPFGGDATTVNVAGSGSAPSAVGYEVHHGAGYRAVYDLARPDASLWVAATGQSGHPLSPHYADLTDLWSRGRYLPMTTRREDYQRNALGSLRLAPADRP